MAEFEYLEIDFDELPVSKTYNFGGIDYPIEFHYNQLFDFFTMLVRNPNDQIIFTTKLVYGVNANHCIVEGFPFDVSIIPLDLNDLFTSEVREDLFNKNSLGRVKIYLGKINE
jgi:hypothetical protein